MTPDVWAYFDANTNLLTIAGLKNGANGHPITDADNIPVSAVIAPIDTGLAVGSPITFSYVAETLRWVGVIPSTMGLAMGAEYDATVTVNGGPNLTGMLTLRFLVQPRLATLAGG